MIAVVIIVVAMAILLIVTLPLRRHGESMAPDPGWERTAEVFRDPRPIASCGCGSTGGMAPATTFPTGEPVTRSRLRLHTPYW